LAKKEKRRGASVSRDLGSFERERNSKKKQGNEKKTPTDTMKRIRILSDLHFLKDIDGFREKQLIIGVLNEGDSSRGGRGRR